MRIADLERIPLLRIKVRGLVKCRGLYIFLKRTRHGSKKPFIYCPGGRVEPTDRLTVPGELNLETTLALVRQVAGDLASENVVIGQFLGISKMHNHFREVLFSVEIDTFNFENRSNYDTIDPNRGEIECVSLGKVDRNILSRRATSFFPKEWRKLISDQISGSK